MLASQFLESRLEVLPAIGVSDSLSRLCEFTLGFCNIALLSCPDTAMEMDQWLKDFFNDQSRKSLLRNGGGCPAAVKFNLRK